MSTKRADHVVPGDRFHAAGLDYHVVAVITRDQTTAISALRADDTGSIDLRIHAHAWFQTLRPNVVRTSQTVHP